MISLRRPPFPPGPTRLFMPSAVTLASARASMRFRFKFTLYPTPAFCRPVATADATFTRQKTVVLSDHRAMSQFLMLHLLRAARRCQPPRAALVNCARPGYSTLAPPPPGKEIASLVVPCLIIQSVASSLSENKVKYPLLSIALDWASATTPPHATAGTPDPGIGVLAIGVIAPVAVDTATAATVPVRRYASSGSPILLVRAPRRFLLVFYGAALASNDGRPRPRRRVYPRPGGAGGGACRGVRRVKKICGLKFLCFRCF
ncbi:hypothetical protein GGX14DRAFT_608695 [Mycena pura]|uniref:Uncharacterized protein n=1 Tax=Mycena pura TaxID=153505 RepID=A0AAD6VKK2_9AGAR|nr:hypothetical protein GGX14DRAFT_608695 [Mycena pura]